MSPGSYMEQRLRDIASLCTSAETLDTRYHNAGRQLEYHINQWLDQIEIWKSPDDPYESETESQKRNYKAIKYHQKMRRRSKDDMEYYQGYRKDKWSDVYIETQKMLQELPKGREVDRRIKRAIDGIGGCWAKYCAEMWEEVERLESATTGEENETLRRMLVFQSGGRSTMGELRLPRPRSMPSVRGGGEHLERVEDGPEMQAPPMGNEANLTPGVARYGHEYIPDIMPEGQMSSFPGDSDDERDEERVLDGMQYLARLAEY